MIKLREWQKEALAITDNAFQNKRSVLWEVCPGAGKTFGSLTMYKRIAGGAKKRLICVVPTRHLKQQWAKSAHKLSINLNPTIKGNSRLSRDYDGFIVTYDQLAQNEEWINRMAVGAFVIIDEVHHAGDGRTWGDALSASLHHATHILSLSGTAFRSDNCPIPFVDYKENVAQPDFVYSYPDAIKDFVCRPIAFLPYSGTVEWHEDGDDFKMSLDTHEEPKRRARRLRVALSPQSGWITRMLQDAHHKLSHLRRKNIAAGGLLVGMNKEHVRQLSDIMIEIAGVRPTVVLSDDNQASKKIRDFSKSHDPWLIACNMVSEGIDIPRLQIGVYATTITTKLYFRQFAGRFCRVSNLPGPQMGYVFLPSDPALLQHSQEVENEIKHTLTDIPKQQLSRKEYETVEVSYRIRAGQNGGATNMILRGRQLPLFESGTAVFSPDIIEDLAWSESLVMEPDTEDATLAERKRAISQGINKLVSKISRQTGTPHATLYVRLRKTSDGVRHQKDCTISQLENRLAILQGWQQ